jgi:hypothetical protein
MAEKSSIEISLYILVVHACISAAFLALKNDCGFSTAWVLSKIKAIHILLQHDGWPICVMAFNQNKIWNAVKKDGSNTKRQQCDSLANRAAFPCAVAVCHG